MLKAVYPVSLACAMALSFQNFESIVDASDAVHRERGHLLQRLDALGPGDIQGVDRLMNGGAGIDLGAFREIQARLPRPVAP